MGKTIILNLSTLELKGDVLDVGENFGVIYKLMKDTEEACTVDYIVDENQYLIQGNKYDVCTIFFHLSKLWSFTSKDDLLDEVTKYLKKGAEIYIWDINKEIGQILNNKVRVLLRNNTEKEFELKNINPLSKSSVEETEFLLSKDYDIIETKVWEDIHFIKGKKK